MEPSPNHHDAQTRLLEIWLPLAQWENERHGWAYDGPSLERLILLAAPSLRHAPSLIAAQALFWHYHERVQRGEL
jgi:hypothetical protein